MLRVIPKIHLALFFFFIHHSDHTIMMLVSKPLTGDNYATWCHSMTITFSAKNKLRFVDGTIEKTNAKKIIELALWQRCNDMVLMWIVKVFALDISSSVVYLRTARNVWDDLKEKFLQQNISRLFKIQSEISGTTQNQHPIKV